MAGFHRSWTLLVGLGLAAPAPAAAVVLSPGVGSMDLPASGAAPPPAGDPCAAAAPPGLLAAAPGHPLRWLTLELERPAGPDADWTLVFNAPLLERLDVCLAGSRGAEWRSGGRAVAPAARSIQTHGPAYALAKPGPAGERVRVLARVEADHPGLVRVSAWEAGPWERQDGLLHAASGVGFGAALGILLVALGMALTRPGPAARRFVLFVAAAGLWELTLSGLPGLLSRGWAGPGERLPALLAGVATGLGLLFVATFLSTRQRALRLFRLEAGLAVLAPLSGLAALAVGPLTPLPAALAIAGAALALIDCAHYGLRGPERDRPAIAVGAVLFAAGLALAGFTLALFPLFPGLPLALHAALGTTTAALLVAQLLRVSLLGSLAQRELEAEVERRTRAHRESEARFRVAFQTSPDAISLIGFEDGVYEAVNASFTAFTGHGAAEVVGRSVRELQLWVDPKAERAAIDVLHRTGLVHDLEADFRCKDGAVRRGLVSAHTLPAGPDGRVLVLVVSRDVSDRDSAARERARLEDQLRQAQKMEAVGRLAGGVAHDFNNLLSVISTNVDLAVARLPADPTARECLADIGHACDRATALTRQLLTFSRTSRLDPQPIDLAALVGNMRRLLARALGEHVTLAVEVPPGLHAMADPGQVEQVILNLAVNARDAVSGTGQVMVSGRRADPLELPEALRAGRTAGFVCLTVSDDGAGISPEVQARLFEPFFTTKPRGKGTGLGLSTVYGIVQQHGGHIAVRSAPSRGAAFDVYLPASVTAPREAPRGHLPALAGGTETIVVVEDDPLVRFTTTRVLNGLGYDLLVAHDAAEGLELIRRHPRPVDLLLTDVVMPGMSGPDLAMRALALLPGLRILYTSGHPQVFVDEDGVIGEGVELLRKPFTSAMLASRVRRILGRAGGSAGPEGGGAPAGGGGLCASAG